MKFPFQEPVHFAPFEDAFDNSEVVRLVEIDDTDQIVATSQIRVGEIGQAHLADTVKGDGLPVGQVVDNSAQKISANASPPQRREDKKLMSLPTNSFGLLIYGYNGEAYLNVCAFWRSSKDRKILAVVRVVNVSSKA